MEYIFLAAGVGSRLYPYTKNGPKCLVKVSEDETIIERNIRLIRANDPDASIHIVVGYQFQQIESLVNGCTVIHNPFYKVTNSIASLWFAREVFTKGQDIVVLNADIVFSSDLIREICSVPSESVIYYDSSIRNNGDYNVQAMDGKMVVMGKELEDYSGEYMGITKFSRLDLNLVIHEIHSMVNDGLYDQWYENALVQMSLNMKHLFSVKDISNYDWSEIDSVDNLLKIRNIIKREMAKQHQ